MERNNVFNWGKEAETQWNKNSSSWHSRSRDMWENGSRKQIIPFFSRHVPSACRVLDIGCGDGYGSFKLAQLGHKVTGIDFSAEMIATANKEFEISGLDFLQDDVMNLSAGENEADALLVINCLEWVAEPLQAIRELVRVLKPGGAACVAVLGPTAGPRSNSYPRLKSEPAICNTMMPWEFARLAEENQLKPIDQLSVYKEGVKQEMTANLNAELKQALSFLTLFLCRNEKETV
ncbi:class I SAM-dependent methyltransferase [Bacillus sp. FJAT-42376]|uniref:class I SAM-dependent methyltransferase n=1 Tax=Bacillus sp. FJAT-42376 TaxID=2014076 RepID=UPI000F516AA3|nr:class I SAM-dependent methyltransferase [Bacillus sp. FJAT-42376]AZB43267.1 class I SAM-dependent methyltransferase [Bacillus sp. FJAT-42376]